jgi:UDP-N-acetylglucosamine enolpyruvyl transferase
MLLDGACKIENVPDVADINVMMKSVRILELRSNEIMKEHYL